MTYRFVAGAALMTLTFSLAAAGAAERVKAAVELKAVPFPITAVRLLDGPFKRAQELDRAYLLRLDVDRLLHTFRLNAGLPSAARPLGGWEEPECELRGHFAGHYLTACALVYAATGDERLKARVDAMVAGLAEVQAKLGPGGYLSAFPEEFIDRVEAQRPVWAPYYTLHKIHAGLLDAYVHCGNAQALDVARRFGDWVIARNARLDDERMQRMLGNEHGGMNESLARLYQLTGEEKYLAISRRFNHEAVIGPASRKADRLTGLHANTQVPKFIGTALQHELTGDATLRAASEFFWDVVVNERSYVIGGHSDGEMFSPKERLSTAFGPNTTETCNTYNMLKLTARLFGFEPRAEYADYYERAVLNHILASQDPASGGMCYYVPLRPGSKKVYGGETDAFWCCTGTGVENHARYNEAIYFRDPAGTTLYVNLFIASTLEWKERGITLRQESGFPESGRTRLTFAGDPRGGPIALKVRRPAWAKAFEVKLNGTKVDVAGEPGSYATIGRAFRDGDVVEVSMPFALRTEGFKDNPSRFAFLHGPVVLAAEVRPGGPVPAVVGEVGRATELLRPVEGRASTFAGSPEGFKVPGGDGAAGATVTLEPFYRMHGGRHYTVYFDALTPEQWRAKEAEHLAAQRRRAELAARTVDAVEVGREASEREHKLAGERTGAGDFRGRRYRHATDGGRFSYELKVADAAVEQQLLVTYWGSDAGNRVFDILIDGKKLATERLDRQRPDEFFDRAYALPAELIAGKRAVTVTFQAQPGAWAGGIFDLRVVRLKAP